MFELSPLVTEANAAASLIPASSSTWRSKAKPTTRRPLKLVASLSKALAFLSIMATECPELSRFLASSEPTRPDPAMMTCTCSELPRRRPRLPARALEQEHSGAAILPYLPIVAGTSGFFERLTRSPDDLRADVLRAWRRSIPGVTPIDGSGDIVAKWLGRPTMSGIRLGIGLVMEGIVGAGHDGEKMILNPDYQLVPGPEHG